MHEIYCFSFAATISGLRSVGDWLAAAEGVDWWLKGVRVRDLEMEVSSIM
jgi:hypothetical protein